MTWLLPVRGRIAAELLESASKVIRPNGSWKKTADMPIVAIARAIAARDRHAVDAAARRQRDVGDGDDRRRAGLLELADDQRARNW